MPDHQPPRVARPCPKEATVSCHMKRIIVPGREVVAVGLRFDTLQQLNARPTDHVCFGHFVSGAINTLLLYVGFYR